MAAVLPRQEAEHCWQHQRSWHWLTQCYRICGFPVVCLVCLFCGSEVPYILTRLSTSMAFFHSPSNHSMGPRSYVQSPVHTPLICRLVLVHLQSLQAGICRKNQIQLKTTIIGIGRNRMYHDIDYRFPMSCATMLEGHGTVKKIKHGSSICYAARLAHLILMLCPKRRRCIQSP